MCSGIEAASVAWEPLGWKAAWYSQFDPDHKYKNGPDFASAVLAHRYPDVPNLGDMTRIHDNETFNNEEIDILVGGTPCQSFSAAGKRRGLRDPRGRLALAYAQIARCKRPRWVVWENVPGVLSSKKGRDFGAFLGTLAECGYSLAYRVLDAQYYGVPQQRRRVFVVGHLDGAGEGRAVEVLFDSEGGPWNAPPKPPRRLSPALPLEYRPEIGWEADSDEKSHCLLAGAGKKNETLLIDGDEMDDLLDPNVAVIRFGDPADDDDDPPLVRRLMPVEWERLQGFPDDYTQIPYRGKPAELCPNAPRYKAIGNSMAVPVLRWIGQRIAAIEGLSSAEVAQSLGPENVVVQQPAPEAVAKGLSDSELVEKCVQGFRDLREAVPYLREAHDRFSQPGRRVPVPGNPTWTEWVQANLHVTVRRVQQLLSEGAEPREIISLGPKQRSHGSCVVGTGAACSKRRNAGRSRYSAPSKTPSGSLARYAISLRA